MADAHHREYGGLLFFSIPPLSTSWECVWPSEASPRAQSFNVAVKSCVLMWLGSDHFTGSDSKLRRQEDLRAVVAVALIEVRG